MPPRFMKVYLRLGGAMTSVTSENEVPGAMGGVANCAILVDALLGTGVQGDVRALYARVIDAWPDVETIAVDLPSGMNADTGSIGGLCIRADTTVTFQFSKKGFSNPAAAPYLGTLLVADIGIPNVCADDEAWLSLMKP